MYQRMYQAVIFDLDGTLIDSEALAFRTGIEALQELGLAADISFFHRLIGRDEAASNLIIAEAWPDMDPLQIRTALQEAFETASREEMPLKPGALELLDQIRLPLALCTSSMRESARRKLGVSGLSRYFGHVITREDVRCAKPHPEPYLTTALRLGIAPAHCVVFEDSETGAASARAAGCVVVQVPDVLPSTGEFADHLADSLLSGARGIGLIP